MDEDFTAVQILELFCQFLGEWQPLSPRVRRLARDVVNSTRGLSAFRGV